MHASVSSPEQDSELVDAYADTQGSSLRSAALHQAVTILRSGQRAGAYEGAWREWDASGKIEVWDSVTAWSPATAVVYPI